MSIEKSVQYYFTKQEALRRQRSVAEFARLQAALLSDVFPESILDRFNPVARAADDEKQDRSEADELEAQAHALRVGARAKLATSIDEASASLVEHSSDKSVDSRTLILGYVGLHNFAEQVSERVTIHGERIAPSYIDEESVLGVFDGLKADEPAVGLRSDIRSGIVSSDATFAIKGSPAFSKSGRLNLSAYVEIPLRVINEGETADESSDFLIPVKSLPTAYVAGREAVRTYFKSAKFEVGHSNDRCGHGARNTNQRRLELDLKLAAAFTTQGIPMPTEQLLQEVEKAKQDEERQRQLRARRRPSAFIRHMR